MDSPVQSESYGRYLQAARLAKGISLEQVAAQTRVGIRVLEAIEHEDFRRLPPETFLKGFLRAFAKVVGVDGEEAVHRYAAHRLMARKVESVGCEPRQGRLGATGSFLIVLVLLALLVAVQLAGWHCLHRAPSEPRPAGALTTPDPFEATPAAGSLPDAQPLAPAPGPALKLYVTALESTWVKVVTDQGTPGEYTLRAGQQLKLEARRHFNLLIGNAGAVKLTLNDQPVAVPGKRGEPVNLNLP